MDIIHHFLFRDIGKEVNQVCLIRLQKKYLIILTCFVLHSLRIFNILYASLRNNVYGPLSFFTPVDLSAPLWNASRHQKCIFTLFFRKASQVSVFLRIFVTKLLKGRRNIACRLSCWQQPDPPLSTYQRFSTLGARFSRFSRHFWRPFEGEKVSTGFDRSFDHFSLFELCFGWEKSVYHRFVLLRFQGKDFGRIQLLETSIWRCDETTTTGKQI